MVTAAVAGIEGGTVASTRETTVAKADVQRVGRLGSSIHERSLPSGDMLTVFSVVVDRPPRDRRGRVSVDTIACVTASRVVARRLGSLGSGAWVRAEGVLRRRFWRSGAGLGSAMEVDVRRISRLGPGPTTR